MCNVDVLWPKLFVQALAQAPQSEFRDGKDTSERVAPQSGSGAGEDQGSPLARAFVRMFGWIGQFVRFKRCYHGSRKRKGTNYSSCGRTFDVFVCHIKELLKGPFPSIIDGDTNLRRGKVGADGRECGLDVRGSVALNWEGLGLSGISDGGG